MPKQVLVPLAPGLTADCPPEYRYGPALTIDDLRQRLTATELALARCRRQLAEIRGLQP